MKPKLSAFRPNRRRKKLYFGYINRRNEYVKYTTVAAVANLAVLIVAVAELPFPQLAVTVKFPPRERV